MSRILSKQLSLISVVLALSALLNGQLCHGEHTANVSNTNLTGVFANGENNIWLVGEERVNDTAQGVILSSSDWGKSWSRTLIDSQASFFDIKFIDSQLGFVVGWSRDQSGIILMTKDGGKHWSRLHVEVKGLLIKSHFVDSNWGWVLSANGFIVHTADGGKTWRRYRIKKTRGLNSISSVGRNKVWVVGENGQAYQSNNNGKNWRSRGQELLSLLRKWRPKQLKFVNVTLLGSKLGFIAGQFLTERKDANNEIVFDYRGVVFKTEDAGVTWTPNVVSTNLGLAKAQFISETDAWVVPTWGWVENTLLHSLNGGQSWVKVPYEGEVARPFNIYFVDSKNGWLLTSDGIFSSELLHTNDGGKTWIRRTN
jgi:photosystem II stability/assembly factor-like uncharacterized protein